MEAGTGTKRGSEEKKGARGEADGDAPTGRTCCPDMRLPSYRRRRQRKTTSAAAPAATAAAPTAIPAIAPALNVRSSSLAPLSTPDAPAEVSEEDVADGTCAEVVPTREPEDMNAPVDVPVMLLSNSDEVNPSLAPAAELAAD